MFEKLKSEGLVCVMTIGATVYETLHFYLDKMNFDVVKLDQPQARLEGGYWTNFKRIYNTCQKYGIK
ncbi:MAG: hypothetical protein ACHQ1H_11730 [Nitrososphaerales archaeon]